MGGDTGRLSHIEGFAMKYGLVLKTEKEGFLAGSRHIPGRNGSVIESRTPGRLLVSIVYLSGWERTKLEFRLAYRHIRVLPDKSSGMSLCAEFSADDERQARFLIKVTQLKTLANSESHDRNR